jgi:hypothetical protein
MVANRRIVALGSLHSAIALHQSRVVDGRKMQRAVGTLLAIAFCSSEEIKPENRK